MEFVNQIDFTYFFEIAIVVGIGVIGLVQLIKNFFKSKKGKTFAIISSVLTVGLCVLNSSLVPSVVTAIIDMCVLSLAMTQLAWDVLARAVPNAIGAFFDKMTTKAQPVAEEKNCEET